LPDIVASDYAVGHFEIVECCIPLMLVGGDQSFIAFSSGVKLLASNVYVNVCTGAFIQTLLDDALSVVDENLLCSQAVIAGHEKIVMAEGTVIAASSALDWLWQAEARSLLHDAVNAALETVKSPPRLISTLYGTGSPYC